MCNRCTSEECRGKSEKITRRCELGNTKGVGSSCHLGLGWLVVIGAGEITQFPSGKPKYSVAAAVEKAKAFVEAEGEEKEIEMEECREE